MRHFRPLVVYIVGPVPVTPCMFTYILTALIPTTKFPEVAPPKDRDATTLADVLLFYHEQPFAMYLKQT